MWLWVARCPSVSQSGTISIPAAGAVEEAPDDLGASSLVVSSPKVPSRVQTGESEVNVFVPVYA